jgi:phosphatidylserine synthase
MNSVTRTFFRQIFILASLIAIVVIAAVLLLPKGAITPTLPFLVVFHTAATILSFLFIQKKTVESPKKFVNVYLINTTVKLLLYMVILMVYAMNYFTDAINFVISFFTLYVIYTIFEVIHLLRVNKQISSQEKK